MKKNDLIFIAVLFIIGLLSLLGFKLYESQKATGNLYAKIFYQETLVLMIDMRTYDYTVYQSPYQNQIDTGRAEEGIFYVPGYIMTPESMEALWAIDSYAQTHEIVGIKLRIEDEKIRVDYQVSPKDLCELQPPTDSSLQPIVCLPNQLVINVMTDMTSDEFIPDAIIG